MTPITVFAFVKPNRMGMAKTRLARDIGKTEARRINAMSTARALRALDDQRWTGVLSVAPDTAVKSRQPLWPDQLIRIPQGGGDLGDRLTRAFDLAPLGRVIFVGSDMPDLRPADIHAASQKLLTHNAVFGPADDGGFWLFGMTKTCRTKAPFDDVRWSSQWALADVRDNLQSDRIAYLDERIDIDDLDALTKWRAKRRTD